MNPRNRGISPRQMLFSGGDLMRCTHCKSIALIRFVDGFGQRRVFCRNCKISYIDRTIRSVGSQMSQRNLLSFKPEVYYRPEAVRQVVR